MYLKYIPRAIRSGLSKATWTISNENSVYLTFDDGPSKDTQALLDVLSQYEAKASFFLLGENADAHPEMVARIRSEGHGMGNHGYRHLDGWRTSHDEYLKNMHLGKEAIGTSDYRPPYGRMSPQQWKSISATERVIMWTVMPGDFDAEMDADTCFALIESLTKAGDIIVLHDNRKSLPTVLDLLPRILTYFKEKGLQTEPLPSR